MKTHVPILTLPLSYHPDRSGSLEQVVYAPPSLLYDNRPPTGLPKPPRVSAKRKRSEHDISISLAQVYKLTAFWLRALSPIEADVVLFETAVNCFLSAALI